MGRILLIEDEESSQLLFRNRLQDLGHEVVTASTGAEGLLEARAGTFDLFLVDVVLGSGIDGYEVCRRIKAIPQKHGIPVVIISGQLKHREDLHRGYEAGCEAFLIKGDLPLIEDVVRAMLHLKSLQDDLAMQNRLLEQQNRRLQEERRRGADLESALRDTGDRSMVFRELAAGRPDGMLLVDSGGLVHFADRGAIDILGKDLEGRNLGSLAPESGLEAFVRAAKPEAREAFRFDLSVHGGHTMRQLSASVVPMVPVKGGRGEGLRAVLLLDAGKRRVAAEMLRLQEQGIPRREIGPLLEAARVAFHPSALIGDSPEMTELRRQVAAAALGEGPTLILGGPGSGKERVARAVHFGSNRSGAFVPVNCAALTPDLLESELFGHVKDAFDGAIADRPGLFQQAHLGTIFLDGVHVLTEELQAKLERVLERGEVVRVGSTAVEHVEVHVILSSKEDLAALVRTNEFSRELHRAASAVELVVPDLVQRPGDVRPLATQFLRRHDQEHALELPEEVLWVLENHDWPGNVRELENCIERACATAEGTSIELRHLPQALRDLASGLGSGAVTPRVARRPEGADAPEPDAGSDTLVPVPHGGTLPIPARMPDDSVEPPSFQAYERLCIEHALRMTDGDKLAAAKLLGVGKSTLYRKLKAHGMK